MEELNRKEMAQEALKAINELEDETKIEDIVKDNMIKFEIDKINYRIRQPHPSETKEAFNARRMKYLEMIKDKSFLFKKQWIKLYQEKGQDINKMEKDFIVIKSQLEKVAIELAQIKDKPTIKRLKDEIRQLRTDMYAIAEEKANLLSYSIEDQLTIFFTTYLCYLVFEKLEGDKWIRCFDTYKEFDITDTPATTQALSFINYIIYRVK